MVALENIVWLLVLIGVMILVHELGHYWAARFFDVRIDVFSFGFGPRLFGFRRGETDFRFSAILFGGYVKMAGEQPSDENISDPRAFLAKPRWQRLIIAFAGPAMNIVLAVALVTGMFMVRYPKAPDSVQEGVVGYVEPGTPAYRAGVREGDRIVTFDSIQNPTWEDIVFKEIGSVNRPIAARIDRKGRQFNITVTPVSIDERTGLASSGWRQEGEVEVGALSPGMMPAEKAGLRRGDILLRANGQLIRSQSRFSEIINGAGGRPVEIDYLRDGKAHSVTIQPIFDKTAPNPTGPPGRWLIGVYPQPRMIITKLSFPEALKESIEQNRRSATLIYSFLRGIVERRMSARTLQGPIGIAQLSGEAAREGAFAFTSLMAMVSLNLAIFNLLPIPILDGGVILLLLVEMTMRRDLSLRVKETVFKLGFVFLMAIMAFVLYNDISKMLPPG
ncbi:MAG TPA: RIP metalloprotease RseP [Bryobacteraceae bacterium]|nr:RIP metalloprotease RseP [Bryobacteraceae bacterium]